jgi:hypothetical protein
LKHSYLPLHLGATGPEAATVLEWLGTCMICIFDMHPTFLYMTTYCDLVIDATHPACHIRLRTAVVGYQYECSTSCLDIMLSRWISFLHLPSRPRTIAKRKRNSKDPPNLLAYGKSKTPLYESQGGRLQYNTQSYHVQAIQLNTRE